MTFSLHFTADIHQKAWLFTRVVCLLSFLLPCRKIGEIVYLSIWWNLVTSPSHDPNWWCVGLTGFLEFGGPGFGESNSCKGKEQVQGIKVPCKSLLKPIFHSQLIWELKIFTTSKGLFLEDQFWECSFGSQIRVLFALATPSEGTLIQMSPIMRISNVWPSTWLQPEI